MRTVAITARGEAPALVDLPDREPGRDEVRVTVETASVNGFDVAVAAGYVWDALPHEFPVVLGRDCGGIVESVGAGVTGVDAGDRVCAVIPGVGLGPTGTIAERFTGPASAVAKVPAAVTPVQAAAIGLAGVTAFDLVTALDMRDGDVVLVSGATGGVGAFAVQLAAARGARVIATARPGEPSDLVRRLGAAEVADFSGDLTAAVKAAAPDGVTKVVHTAGDATALAALLGPGGPLASALGAEPDQVGRDDVTVTSLLSEPTTEKLTTLLEAAASGQLSVIIDRTYAMEDIAEALSAFGTGKIGKIVITVA